MANLYASVPFSNVPFTGYDKLCQQRIEAQLQRINCPELVLQSHKPAAVYSVTWTLTDQDDRELTAAKVSTDELMKLLCALSDNSTIAMVTQLLDVYYLGHNAGFKAGANAVTRELNGDLS